MKRSASRTTESLRDELRPAKDRAAYGRFAPSGGRGTGGPQLFGGGPSVLAADATKPGVKAVRLEPGIDRITQEAWLVDTPENRANAIAAGWTLL